MACAFERTFRKLLSHGTITNFQKFRPYTCHEAQAGCLERYARRRANETPVQRTVDIAHDFLFRRKLLQCRR